MSIRTASSTTASDQFEALIAAHRGIVLKIAASYCRNADDRADLAQDIALQLWHAWPSFDDSRPFSTWMYRIALNVAISQQRRRWHRTHESLDDAHEQLIGASDVDAETAQQLLLVQRAVQAFGAVDRALLLLHLEGCSHREIGDVLGISDSNAATRLGRIRQQLRRIAGAPSSTGDEDHGHA